MTNPDLFIVMNPKSKSTSIFWLSTQDWTTCSYTLSRDTKEQETSWDHWWGRGREKVARWSWTHPFWKAFWGSCKWHKKKKAMVPEWLQRWHSHPVYCLHYIHILCLPYSHHHLWRPTWRSHRKQNCCTGVSCCWIDLWSNVWSLLWSTLNYSGVHWSCLSVWNYFVWLLQVRKVLFNHLLMK